MFNFKSNGVSHSLGAYRTPVRVVAPVHILDMVSQHGGDGVFDVYKIYALIKPAL